MKQKGAFEKTRNLVAKIPRGRVTTYGDIAKALGITSARVVGWAVRGNKNPEVPCHRVVRKNGFLAEGYSLGGWKGQKKRLLPEGISFIGERQVNIKKHGWPNG